MMNELKHHEILAAIREQVTPAAHEYLCGVCDGIEQELIGIALRQGIDAAVAEAELLTPPEFRMTADEIERLDA